MKNKTNLLCKIIIKHDPNIRGYLIQNCLLELAGIYINFSIVFESNILESNKLKIDVLDRS